MAEIHTTRPRSGSGYEDRIAVRKLIKLKEDKNRVCGFRVSLRLECVNKTNGRRGKSEYLCGSFERKLVTIHSVRQGRRGSKALVERGMVTTALSSSSPVAVIVLNIELYGRGLKQGSVRAKVPKIKEKDAEETR